MAGRNETLAWAMRVVEWSPERLVREVNRALGARRRSRAVTASSAYKWRDHGAVPRDPLATVVAVVLSEALGEPISVERLWQGRARDSLTCFPADFGLDVPWTQAGTVELLDVVRGDAVNRRDFLAVSGLALTAPAMEWAKIEPGALGAVLGGDRVRQPLLDLVDHDIAALRRIDDIESGVHVLAKAEGEFAFVSQVLRAATYDGRSARRLHIALAELGQLAGWISRSLDDRARSQRHFLTGLHAAHSAGDRALGARILTCMAVDSTSAGRPGDALALLESAERGGGAELTPAVRAMVAFTAARAHAASGDDAACGVALNKAQRLFDQSRGDGEPAWIYWLSSNAEAYYKTEAGICFTDLGPDHLRRAERYLTEGIAQFGPDLARDRVDLLPDLAEVQRRRRELDQACATALRALRLNASIGSVRCVNQVREFRDALAPDARAAPVSAFIAEAEPFLRAA